MLKKMLCYVALGIGVTHITFANPAKVGSNTETITVKFVNKSNTTFERISTIPDVRYEFMEGGLPLRPGESITMLVEKKPRTYFSLRPNCPPGVCNYSARCGSYPYDGLSAGTWTADRVESTPVGPMIVCHK